MQQDLPLKSSDMVRALDGKVKLYSYDQIVQFQTIDELLEPYGRVIILYFWKTTPAKIGHWTSVHKTPWNTIEFFDSYGSIERTLKDLPKEIKQATSQDYPHITKLLYESKYETEYNDKKLQDYHSNVCGRYVLSRLATTEMHIEDFQKVFNMSPKENDKLVMEITNFVS